jgi:hypothetical protein
MNYSSNFNKYYVKSGVFSGRDSQAPSTERLAGNGFCELGGTIENISQFLFPGAT